MAIVLRQLAANLISPVSGGAYYDVRKVTPEWNARPNIGTRLNSEAGRTKP